jgi:hypothetical protein
MGWNDVTEIYRMLHHDRKYKKTVSCSRGDLDSYLNEARDEECKKSAYATTRRTEECTIRSPKRVRMKQRATKINIGNGKQDVQSFDWGWYFDGLVEG